MRVKTSITLPKDLLKSIDREDANRSAFIEKAARHYLWRLERARRGERDQRLIEENIDYLNREALHALRYQKLP